MGPPIPCTTMDVPNILVTESGSRKRQRGHWRTKAEINIPVYDHNQDSWSNSRSPTRYSEEEDGDDGDDRSPLSAVSSEGSKRRRFFADQNTQDLEHCEFAPPSPHDDSTYSHLLAVDVNIKNDGTESRTRPKGLRRDHEDWENLQRLYAKAVQAYESNNIYSLHPLFWKLNIWSQILTKSPSIPFTNYITLFWSATDSLWITMIPLSCLPHNLNVIHLSI